MAYYELFTDVPVRAMVGRYLVSCWTATVRWDATVKCWATIELWAVLQGLFDQWPFAEGETRCRCRRKLNIRTEQAPDGCEKWGLWCLACQFAVILKQVPDPGSADNVQAVSIRPNAASMGRAGARLRD